MAACGGCSLPSSVRASGAGKLLLRLLFFSSFASCFPVCSLFCCSDRDLPSGGGWRPRAADFFVRTRWWSASARSDRIAPFDFAGAADGMSPIGVGRQRSWGGW